MGSRPNSIPQHRWAVRLCLVARSACGKAAGTSIEHGDFELFSALLLVVAANVYPLLAGYSTGNVLCALFSACLIFVFGREEGLPGNPLSVVAVVFGPFAFDLVVVKGGYCAGPAALAVCLAACAGAVLGAVASALASRVDPAIMASSRWDWFYAAWRRGAKAALYGALAAGGLSLALLMPGLALSSADSGNLHPPDGAVERCELGAVEAGGQEVWV